MKLEVGMYVRTKSGMIAKIIDKRDVSGSLHREERVFILDNGNRLALHSQKVVKASHNIIDLIEVGDYVNAYEVTSIQEVEEPYYPKRLLFVEEPQDYVLQCFNNEDIKTIVTKEQFESMSYKVGE